MFASASASNETISAEAGFGVSRSRLALLSLRGRVDEMMIFYVVAIALLAAIVVPAWQAAQTKPVAEERVEISRAAEKGDRLQRRAIDIACSGVTYGNETTECLVAIAKDSGREPVGSVRVVNFAAING